MSLPYFSTLNQLIVWLQQLYEQQKKGKLDSEFAIKNYLCYENLPSYQLLIADTETLRHCAARLFSAPVDNVKLIKKNSINREHCLEIVFEIDNEEKVFFIKHAWEGAIKEAVGLEFNNLLTDTTIRYLCSDEIIITEKVFEALPADTLFELRQSPDYIFAYGAWEIFTRILRLTDRKTSNVRWNGQRLANIDFGLVFYKGNPVYDSRFTLTESPPLRKQGQIFALKHLLAHFQQHQQKLASLLLNLDVHFCRSMECSRIPREPLRVLLTALKEINQEINATIKADFQPQKIIDTSALKSLLNHHGVLYVAVAVSDGTIIGELKSAKYSAAADELKNPESSYYSLLHQHLTELMTDIKNNSLLNTEIESMQIDLTEGRLLVIWDKQNGFIALCLLKLEASVAHVKVKMRRILETLDIDSVTE